LIFEFCFAVSPSSPMSLHIVVLTLYSLTLMAIGLWIGRRVRGASDFFVAGRQLGPGLIFSTMLAANIGAGSTVGATGIGYSHGVSAWWWVGSAALGSTVLAFCIGPSMRRVAASHNLRTVGDYLEFRYSRGVRGALSTLLWLASIAIPAGQLIAIGGILEAVADVPFALGCTLGGAVIVVYFTAGGLLTSAWVNVVQLTVKLAGFAVAVPLAVAAIGGWSGLSAIQAPEPAYWAFWRPAIPGVMYIAALGPAFFLSPGLLQKVFGARDDRAVRVGVGLNALGLFLYAGVPVLLGLVARGQFPSLADERQALPMLLIHTLPPLVGTIGLAAVFSAEVSAADAGLFMLTTSLSQDLYKRFVAPAASDRRVLQIARWTSFVCGVLAVLLAIASASIVQVLTLFYTVLTVVLFVPIVGGLYVSRTTTRQVWPATVAGVLTMLVMQFVAGDSGWGVVTPALGGLLAAIAAWAIGLAFSSPARVASPT
jgi:SSS family solute:Na+ symporter